MRERLELFGSDPREEEKSCSSSVAYSATWDAHASVQPVPQTLAADAENNANKQNWGYSVSDHTYLVQQCNIWIPIPLSRKLSLLSIVEASDRLVRKFHHRNITERYKYFHFFTKGLQYKLL